jgi:hypothetical protein
MNKHCESQSTARRWWQRIATVLLWWLERLDEV